MNIWKKYSWKCLSIITPSVFHIKKGSLQMNANCLLNLESGAGGNR